MSQKLPLHSFKWVNQAPQFRKDYLENYNEDSDEGYFLEVDIPYPEKLHDLHDDLHERIKIEKVENLLAVYMIKNNISHIINLKFT